MMHPIFDELSLKYKNVVFLRVEGDQHRDISSEYGISGFPTFVFVYHGDEVDRIVGADPEGLESKIQQYAQSAQTFTGTGNTLGGETLSQESVREMRLKRFKDVRLQGSSAASGVSRMMKHLTDNVDSEEEVVKEEEHGKSGYELCVVWHRRDEDASIRDSLLTMGFSSANVDRVWLLCCSHAKTLKECKSRDIADLVTYISGLPDDEKQEETEVVCDGNTCRLVPKAKVEEAKPQKTLEERIAETKELMEKRKREKEEKDKEAEKKKEKERIEKGKEMLLKKEEFERQQRQREIEKEKRERQLEEQEKQRQLELWRKEHGLPEHAKFGSRGSVRCREKVVEKTPEEKAKLLAESVALQRIDGVGETALRTLTVILKNTSKEDPKYRQLRKDNALAKKKVFSVAGAVPLMLVGACACGNG